MAKGKYQEWLEPEGLLKKAWARDGLTEEQIAENMGIAASTLNNWKNNYMEILESLGDANTFLEPLQVSGSFIFY